jgi:hypothetical protein
VRQAPVVPEAPAARDTRDAREVESEPTAASDNGSVAPMVGRARKRGKPALFDVEATEAAEAADAAKRRTAPEPVEARVVEAPEPESEVARRRPAPPAPPRPAAAPAASTTAPAAPPEAPAPGRAAGPWKSKRARRKREAESASAPWEGRFDTSRDREIPGRAKPTVAPPPGTEPLAVCVRHRGVLTRNRCDRCNEPMCDECQVTPRGRRKSICIECAILESGVRKRRRRKG